MVRKHIIFYGSVQGVGFRWRARNAAEHFSCTGWAKNEWDGSVSMEIQGEEEDIDRVILAIEKGTYYVGYPLTKRSIYYVARSLARQLGVLSGETDYGKLQKCYSIWILSSISSRR